MVDGDALGAGERFVKIWRMRNDGTEAWPQHTRLVFVGGASLSALKAACVYVTVYMAVDMVCVCGCFLIVFSLHHFMRTN